jgi:hypothetical protein
MKLYIIERKVKGKWHPLSFFMSKSKNYELGAELHVHPCINRNSEKADTLLLIAKETFPDDKFRISEWERVCSK